MSPLVLMPAVMSGDFEPFNYYGDESDGTVTFSTNTDLDSDTSADDTGVVIRNFINLTINSSIIVKPEFRSRIMIIYCTGDCTINGTLHMDKLGSKDAPAGDTQFFRAKFGESSSGSSSTDLAPDDTLGGATDRKEYTVTDTGAAGGAQQPDNAAGFDGTAGSGGGCGGGGGGAGNGNNGPGPGGAGGAATAYSGGSGGGGCSGADNGIPNAGGDAVSDTGAGGAGGNGPLGTHGGGGGGAGHPGGAAGTTGGATAGEEGGGGIIYLIVKGTLTIGAAGIISADGGDGGTGGTGVDNGRDGGSGGGGSVFVLHGSNLANSGTIRANGGAQSAGPGPDGGDGGAGSVITEVIF